MAKSPKLCTALICMAVTGGYFLGNVCDVSIIILFTSYFTLIGITLLCLVAGFGYTAFVCSVLPCKVCILLSSHEAPRLFMLYLNTAQSSATVTMGAATIWLWSAWLSLLYDVQAFSAGSLCCCLERILL